MRSGPGTDSTDYRPSIPSHLFTTTRANTPGVSWRNPFGNSISFDLFGPFHPFRRHNRRSGHARKRVVSTRTRSPGASNCAVCAAKRRYATTAQTPCIRSYAHTLSRTFAVLAAAMHRHNAAPQAAQLIDPEIGSTGHPRSPCQARRWSEGAGRAVFTV